MSLANKVVFITGASRGIGAGIALKAASEGATVVLAARTLEADESVGSMLSNSGGVAHAFKMDIRFPSQIKSAIEKASSINGGIDVLVNNASVTLLKPVSALKPDEFDLMLSSNVRGTYLASSYALPFMKKRENPHILNISPPLNIEPKWFKPHTGYTLSKFGMSMCVTGMAEEFKRDKIAVNALWPKLAVYTATTKQMGGAAFAKKCRDTSIMGDAAHRIFLKKSSDPKNTGQYFVDEEVLRESGVTDFSKYSIEKGAKCAPCFFLNH